MLKHIQIRAIVLLCLLVNVSNAQDIRKGKTRTLAAFGISYSSNLNFYGRTDTSKASGVNPSIEYWLSNSTYLSFSPTFVSDAYESMAYAGSSASIGYQKLLGDWFISAGASRSFYTGSSYLSQSVIRNQVYAAASYFSDIINISGGVDFKFSDQADIVLNGGIDHSFISRNANGSIMIIDPSIYAYAGSNYFSRSFLNSKYYGPVANQLGSIKMLATELSLPLMYIKDEIFLMINPSYIIPSNLINSNGLKEMGGPQFYVSACLRYKIKTAL